MRYLVFVDLQPFKNLRRDSAFVNELSSTILTISLLSSLSIQFAERGAVFMCWKDGKSIISI